MKRTIRDLPRVELQGRRALVRVDFNVPLADGRVDDTTRIDASLPTLRLLLAAGASPVLASHLGRPGGAPDPAASLAPVVPILAARLGTEVRFANIDERVQTASRELPEGEALLLENTRFYPGETRNDDGFARLLASVGDLFVGDAFGSMHRAHASTVGVTEYLRPAVTGLLVERELAALERIYEAPDPPFVVAFGGAKISDKIELLDTFLERADRLLVGGAMANTFLRAAGMETGASLVEEDALSVAESAIERGGERLLLPIDLCVAHDPGDPVGSVDVVPADRIPPGAAAMDIGPRTVERFGREIERSRSFFWNGPMGRFEDPRFTAGTFATARAVAEATRAGAFTVVGGGDSASAIHKAGLADQVSHVSTGGGAALEYLSSGSLPGVEALDDVPREVPVEVLPGPAERPTTPDGDDG